ncbi:MAG: hypothetical protein CM15mP59_5820 [Flavobacteriaceae bacterium]|nr:MAG: hypothetical protein CM15mP59_5820 [Flavobacteriaceae bacterium]
MINHTKRKSSQREYLSRWTTDFICLGYRRKRNRRFSFEYKEVDKIVVNPNQFVLETNTNNNSLLLGKQFKKRQKRFRLYEDIPSPAYKSTYFTPNLNYNAYDGLLLGMVFTMALF